MAKSDKPGIRIVAINGTVRPGNYTSKAMALVVDEIAKHGDITLTLIDPTELDLKPGGVASSSDATEQMKEAVSQATGVILATPEYHGSFSAVLKLVIENLGFPSVLARKPISLLGVAAGQIGAIKSLEHLRSVCSHIGAIVLPGPVSVAGVQQVFDEQGNCLDESVEKRIRGTATKLIDYIRGFICPSISLEDMVRSKNMR